MSTQPTNKPAFPNGAIQPDEGQAFLAVWRPAGESHMFHLYPLVLVVIAIASATMFDNMVLAVFLIVLAVSYCVFSVVFRNDERFSRYLWLTGDEYANKSIRCANAFAQSLEAAGVVDKFTKYEEVGYSLEEYSDSKAVFLFSTTQAGKTPSVVSKTFERIAPVFHAYSTKVEVVDAVTYRITYLFDNPSDTLGKTYPYSECVADRG